MDSVQEFKEKPIILVVDDTPGNLSLMNGILQDSYKVKVANNGEKALAIAVASPRPDLILLDVMMPGIDGYEVCGRLKADAATRDIPVIFLTARSDVADEKRGLELGAVDYIAKPVSPPIVLARVKNHLALKAASDFLRDQNEYLEQIVDRRTLEVRAIQEVTIMALASLAETRDGDTGNHLRRTQQYIEVVARDLQADERYALSLSEFNIRTIYRSAPLHDIGKVGIPDRILLKPGKLDPEEFETMKRHTILGSGAIENAERELGSKVEFLSVAKEIALSHHERWDGKGYPHGLAGQAIPLSAQLMAVADVYDALISKRVYKTGMPHEEAFRIIVEGSGGQFNPDIVDSFVRTQEKFKSISARLSDEGSPPKIT
jgi:putative two-component system response regulator